MNLDRFPSMPSASVPLAGSDSGGTPSGWFAACACCFLFLAMWGVACALAFDAPRLDGAEQLVWSASLEGGYWKHPPLPSWTMYFLVQLFGASAALTYAAGQTCVAVALLLTWRAGALLIGERRSLAAMALTSLALFYNVGADAFNHDLALLPLVAAANLCFLQALHSRNRWWWVAMGVVSGLALLAKYAAVIHLAALVVYVLCERRARTARVVQGLGLSASVALAVVSPHVSWLVANDFPPLRYVQALTATSAASGDGLMGTLGFVAGVGARMLPVFVACWFALGWRPAARHVAAQASPASDRKFLWIAGAFPMAVITAYGIATGAAPAVRWGTSGMLLAGWLVLDAWRMPVSRSGLRKTLVLALAIHLSLCVFTTVLRPQFALAWQSPGRTNFPAAALAEAAQDTWDDYTDAPLRLVIADTWLGGNIIAQTPDQPPLVLLDGLPLRAPWVPLDAVRACGALVLVDRSSDAGNDPDVERALMTFMDQAGPHGEWSLPWPSSRPDDALPPRSRVLWGVIAPAPGAACTLPAK